MENIEGQLNTEALHEAHTNAYHRIKHKPVIKFMTVTRFGDNSQRHDIAFLTTDMKFYIFSLRFQQYMHHISYIHHDKIWDIFKNFSINSTTEIVIQDTVDHFCPLMIYFSILQPYLNFWLTTISLSKIVKRIYYKYPRFSKRVATGKSEITVQNVNMFLYRAWNFLIETDACPWITKYIDDGFKLKTPEEANHQKRSRICMFYMLVRRHLSSKNKRYEERKNLAKQNLTGE